MIYTPDEYDELKGIADSISTHIPENRLNYIWNNYQRISGSKGPQPCACSSASKYWKAAVQSIKEYIKQNG